MTESRVFLGTITGAEIPGDNNAEPADSVEMQLRGRLAAAPPRQSKEIRTRRRISRGGWEITSLPRIAVI